MQDASYHCASNTKDDANSLASLTEAFSSLQSHQTQQDMALQTLLQEVTSLPAVISQNQAFNVQQQYQVPANIQFPPPPPVQHYAPLPPPPMINHMPAMPMPPAPPAPTQQQYYTAPAASIQQLQWRMTWMQWWKRTWRTQQQCHAAKQSTPSHQEV